MTFAHHFTRYAILTNLILILSSTVNAETRLEARGVGFAHVTPDKVNFHASVTEIRLSAIEAQAQVNRIIAGLEKALTQFDLDENSMDSSALSLNPEYRWNSEDRKQVFVGYRVTRHLEFTADNVSEIGSIMNALTQSGATEVNTPQLTSSRADDAKEQALRNAVAHALSVVKTMASAAELSIKAINSITEAKGKSTEPSMSVMRTEAATAINTAPSVSVSKLRYSTEVNIVATAN